MRAKIRMATLISLFYNAYKVMRTLYLNHKRAIGNLFWFKRGIPQTKQKRDEIIIC